MITDDLQLCRWCKVKVLTPCEEWMVAEACKEKPVLHPVKWAVRAEPKRGQVEIRDPATRKLISKRIPTQLYVRASSPKSAFLTAKRNNPLHHYTVTGPARIATPVELGCVPTTPKETASA
jgi:hypothetical protein